MNNKFKIGDKVRIIAADHGQPKYLIGGIHTIRRVTGTKEYMLDSDGGWYWDENDLELVKPKFDIKDYPGYYVMHVTSEEQAKIFCEYLHSIGRKWNGGNSYLDHTNYYHYGTRTCYEFNVNKYDEISWFKLHGLHNFTILEFNDFDWSDFMFKKEKEFTKADLKNGDVVKMRDGSVNIVCVDTGTLICAKSGFNLLRDYANDLTESKWNDGEFDIVAVRRPKEPNECRFDAFDCGKGELVYERKEVEEMTLEEVCKALGKEIKIVKK